LFFRDVCKEKIWRFLESPETQNNLPEFYQQELATLLTPLAADGPAEKALGHGCDGLRGSDLDHGTGTLKQLDECPLYLPLMQHSATLG